MTDKSKIDLETYFLLCILDSKSLIHETLLNNFLKPAWFMQLTPFEYISHLNEIGHLRSLVSNAKLGSTDRVTTLFTQCYNIDIETVTLSGLEQIPWVGPEIARKFILYATETNKIVLLTVDILNWLEEHTTGKLIPRSVPQSISRYKELEELYFSHQSIEGDALLS